MGDPTSWWSPQINKWIAVYVAGNLSFNNIYKNRHFSFVSCPLDYKTLSYNWPHCHMLFFLPHLFLAIFLWEFDQLRVWTGTWHSGMRWVRWFGWHNYISDRSGWIYSLFPSFFGVQPTFQINRSTVMLYPYSMTNIKCKDNCVKSNTYKAAFRDNWFSVWHVEYFKNNCPHPIRDFVWIHVIQTN